MADRESLSSVDTAWLRMDRPTNLMMICGIMMFAGQLEIEQLRQVISTRLLCFHRFRQRVVDSNLGARWETDQNFDLNWHVRRIALPGAAGNAELEEVVSDLISTPLDPAKPMWQYHLIEKFNGGSALVMRIHHCYGDGFALTHVVASMTDENPDQPHPPAEDIVRYDGSHTALEHMLGPVSEAIGDAARHALSLLKTGRNWIDNPSQAAEFAEAGLNLTKEAAFIANMAPDSHTRFKGRLSIMKRVAWAEPLSLFEVKALAEALACSINDVLLACVAGALRAYLIEQGDPVDQLNVRALVPVNLRAPGPVTELGNCFGLVFLNLPINVADPLDRVISVRARMDELKHSQQARVALGILAGMGIAPPAVKEKVLESLAANASAVITNVRGAREPRYLAGQRITRQIFWVPQSGGIGLGISILSYAGNIDFGVVSDSNRIPDPGAVVKHFTDQFETLLLMAIMQLCQLEHENHAASRRKLQHRKSVRAAHA